MKKILFVCAMKKEAKLIAEKLKLQRINEELYKKDNIQLLITGIGKQKTAISLATYLCKNEKPELIINVGYAGSTNITIGKWVSITKSYNYEWEIPGEEKYSMKDFGNQELQLSDCTAVHGRAEDLAKNSSYREQYDFCVSRAVANLSTLCEYCMPYVKVGGRFVSYKSEKITEEALNAKHAISVLGGKFERQVEFTLPDSDIYRNIYIIQKEKLTPKKYPRKAGLPSKEPL